MSRAGRRARRTRLIAAGQWTPAAGQAPAIRPPRGEQAEHDRLGALLRERDGWITAVGILGWQREQVRRRAIRCARLRSERLAREHADACVDSQAA